VKAASFAIEESSKTYPCLSSSLEKKSGSNFNELHTAKLFVLTMNWATQSVK
jgi:hypothetical protein